MQIRTEWVEVEEVTLEIKEPGDTFGIGISGGKASGATIRMITKNSVAHENGHLLVGDHILALNGNYFKGMNSGLASKLIRNAKTTLTLLVVRPVFDVTSRCAKDKLVIRSRCLRDPVVKVKELCDEFKHQEISNGYVFFSATLDKGFEELGITAARLITELEDQSTGIFVASIEKGHIIDIDGRIQVGDQITEVNGVGLQNSTIEYAAQLLSQNTHVLRLNIKRHLQSDICNNLTTVMNADDAREPFPRHIGPYSDDTNQNEDGDEASPMEASISDRKAFPNDDSLHIGSNLRVSAQMSEFLDSPPNDEDTRHFHSLNRSRSLGAIYCRQLHSCQRMKRVCSMQLDSGFAMWDEKVYEVTLTKRQGEGLGFSLLSYPTRVDQSCLVIRSIVPGGLLHRDGRINTGDRLISVNGHDVELLPFDHTVQLLQELPPNTAIEFQLLKPRSYSPPVAKVTHRECKEEQNGDRAIECDAGVAFSLPTLITSQMLADGNMATTQFGSLNKVSEEYLSDTDNSCSPSVAKNVPAESENFDTFENSVELEKATASVHTCKPPLEERHQNSLEYGFFRLANKIDKSLPVGANVVHEDMTGG